MPKWSPVGRHRRQNGAGATLPIPSGGCLSHQRSLRNDSGVSWLLPPPWPCYTTLLGGCPTTSIRSNLWVLLKPSLGFIVTTLTMFYPCFSSPWVPSHMQGASQGRIYRAISSNAREVIPLMNVMAEISCVFDEVYMPKPQVKCKVFEDNRSCIAIAESLKFTPRTKHIALKYHHFRSFVKNKALEIFPIDTEEQTADIFTKPLDEKTFLYLRKKLSGW